MVAPVRETAAQALGAAGRALSLAKVGALARHLAALVRRPEWEVRLGGLLGLKYLLASRADAAASLLPEALPAALAGLQVQSHTFTELFPYCKICVKMRYFLQPGLISG